MRDRVAALAAAVWLLSLGPAVGQDATTRTDSDPTRPVLFSVRPEFSQITDDFWRWQIIARYDRAAMRQRRWLSGQRGLLLRFEMPLAFSGLAAGPGAPRETAGGLGDAYAQVLTVPWISGRFALAGGTGLFIPTATDRTLGSGKVTLAPVVAPVWFLRGRGMFYLKFQDFISVAGDDERADAHFFLITPTLIHKLTARSWILVDVESRTDWLADVSGVKTGVQFGYILPAGFGVWVKPEVWAGAGRGGEWNFKTGLVWYR